MGRIYGNYQRDCGFGVKSSKIGIVDDKEVLNDFRYSGKLNLSPDVHKMTKSKIWSLNLEKALSSLIIDINR